MISLGQNLYLWRIFRGMSQDELAEKAGIPRPNLTALESGKYEPSLSTLRRLAVALEIVAGTLINGIGPIQTTSLFLSRKSQERIVRASLGQKAGPLSAEQEAIVSILSGVIKNKLNARNHKFYSQPLKKRQLYIKDWLMLKAAIEPYLLNKLLAQVDKYL